MATTADPDLPNFKLLRTLFYDVTAEMQRVRPREGCGLLFERGASQVFYAVRNTELDRPSARFTMDPHELMERMQWAEDHGFGLAAIVHSHVHPSPGRPSRDDAAMAAQYPDAVQLLVLVGRFVDWHHEITAWRYRGGQLRQCGLTVPDSTAIGTATNPRAVLNGLGSASLSL